MRWRPFDAARDLVSDCITKDRWKRGLLVRYGGEVFLIGDANGRGGTCQCCETVPPPRLSEAADVGMYEVCDELLSTVETFMEQSES